MINHLYEKIRIYYTCEVVNNQSLSKEREKDFWGQLKTPTFPTLSNSIHCFTILPSYFL